MMIMMTHCSFRDDKTAAHVRLCKSRKFQELIQGFFTEMFSCEGEEYWDALRNLKRLCTDEGVLQVPCTVAPHPLREGRPGVPVCALPFVMAQHPPPVVASKYYELRQRAMDLLEEFNGAMEELKNMGFSARFEHITDQQKIAFAEEAMEFAKEYVRCTTNDVPTTRARLLKEIPALYTRFENPQATDEERMEFLDAKAIYFGLYGYSLSVVELARLRGLAMQRT